jgi:hypothetical protein
MSLGKSLTPDYPASLTAKLRKPAGLEISSQPQTLDIPSVKRMHAAFA